MQTTEQHFDHIAHDYDFWKKKNWYYYTNLISLYKSLIPPRAHVLEIGCGTGDILVKLDAESAKGIDISAEMIEIAQKKHSDKKSVTFERQDIYERNDIFSQDYIFLADVLEHIDDVPRFIAKLSSRTKKDAIVIMSVANPIWEPILMLAEKMHMKMPEGPHDRLSIKRNEEIFKENSFELIQKDYRLLVPKKVPGSDFINKHFYKNKLLSRLGFTIFWVLKKK